jgi:hypothetical protein
VAIGNDIIIVVRDSSAEVYPRDKFTILDPSQVPPPGLDIKVVRGDIDYLPTTYATDIGIFPCTFTSTPKIHIHEPRPAASVSGGQRVELCVRPISLIGVGRTSTSPADPSIPYLVITTKLYLTPTSQTPGDSIPSTSTPLPPSHATPAPEPLPLPDRYKYTFHIHALQPQHPHLSYGPILAGPNGRGVMLATNKSSSGTPRQRLIKFWHPSNEELSLMIHPDANLIDSNIRPHRLPQSNASLPLPPLPPLALRTLPPNMQHNHPPNHMIPAPNQGPPHPDPFAPLFPIMRRCAQLDVLGGMSTLWTSIDPTPFEFLAWDEGGGSLLISSQRGTMALFECAFPPVRPRPLPEPGRSRRRTQT